MQIPSGTSTGNGQLAVTNFELVGVSRDALCYIVLLKRLLMISMQGWTLPHIPDSEYHTQRSLSQLDHDEDGRSAFT